MSEIEKVGGGGIIDVIHGGGGIELPKPFAREIYLFETHVAGTSHIENIDSLVDTIEIGSRLKFFREAENDHDTNAIKVELMDGSKIGYVPKADNPVFARLMDAGKLLFGKISKKEKQGNWHKLTMKIYLDE